MAYINLAGSARDVLKRIIAEENPGFETIPDFYTFGSIVPGVGTRTSVSLVGNPGKESEVRASGIRTIQYNRADLQPALSNQKPLAVYGCTTTHEILNVIGNIWGIVIDPSFVVNEEIIDVPDVVKLTFVNHEQVIMNASVDVSVSWSNEVDINTIFKITDIAGPTAPWPYPIYIADIFTVLEVAGPTPPDVQLNMSAVSQHWHVHDPELVRWAIARTVSGPYVQASLVEMLQYAAPQYPWKCVDNEMATFNLWGATITYNGVSTDSTLFTHVIKIRVNTTYFHEGIGEISVYYNI